MERQNETPFFLLFLITIPALLFSQYISDDYRLDADIDIIKFNLFLKTPFQNSILSFDTMNDQLFFFELMTKNDLELNSSVYIRGPVASSVWEIYTEGISMDVFIDRMDEESTEFATDFRLNTLAYSKNFNVKPKIEIGMTAEELKSVLGPWNYEDGDAKIYYHDYQYIEFLFENDRIVKVLIIMVIDV